MENAKQFKVSIAGQDLVFETGLLAQQAAGAVTCREIKGGTGFPCAQCVETAARLLEN